MMNLRYKRFIYTLFKLYLGGFPEESPFLYVYLSSLLSLSLIFFFTQGRNEDIFVPLHDN